MPTKNETKEEFHKLTADIDWQRPGFLKYCIGITEGSASDQGPEEIVVKKILGDYLTLALLFSKQFWDDLKSQYEKDSIDEPHVKLKMQEALDKLVDEWFRVYGIIQSIRGRNSNIESKRIVDLTTPFVDIAMRDVGLKPEEFPVILQFGQSYSMRFSNYSGGFAALSMPLWILGSPWEWTILWHELAGEKVRMLKTRMLENDKIDSFEKMFNKTLKELKAEESDVQDFGWSVDWFEELFEDSFSVIHFPINFLIVFKNLLERYPDSGEGMRHPPRSVRLAVAMCLYAQMNNITELPVRDKWPSWDAWSELESEKDEFKGKFEEFNPYQQLTNDFDVKMAWQVAQTIIKWHQKEGIATNTENDFRKVVSEAVIAYSYENFKEGEKGKILDNTIEAIAKLPKPKIDWQKPTDTIYSNICDVIKEMKLSEIGKKKKRDLLEEHPQVKKLLDGLGYQELLNLRFSDSDFLGTSIEDVKLNGNLKYAKISWMGSLPLEVTNSVTGNVTYKVDNVAHRTTSGNWNSVFVDNVPKGITTYPV